MTNRIVRFCVSAPNRVQARTTFAFCDAIWHLHLDPRGLEDWEIDSLCRLEREAMTALRGTRVPQV